MTPFNSFLRATAKGGARPVSTISKTETTDPGRDLAPEALSIIARGRPHPGPEVGESNPGPALLDTAAPMRSAPEPSSSPSPPLLDSAMDAMVEPPVVRKTDETLVIPFIDRGLRRELPEPIALKQEPTPVAPEHDLSTHAGRFASYLEEGWRSWRAAQRAGAAEGLATEKTQALAFDFSKLFQPAPRRQDRSSGPTQALARKGIVPPTSPEQKPQRLPAPPPGAAQQGAQGARCGGAARVPEVGVRGEAVRLPSTPASGFATPRRTSKGETEPPAIRIDLAQVFGAPGSRRATVCKSLQRISPRLDWKLPEWQS